MDRGTADAPRDACEVLHESVKWELDGPIARMVLARPDAGNALNLKMAHGLEEAASRVRKGAADGTVRVAVLSAEGRFFCVGGDLGEFAGSCDRGAEVGAVAAGVHKAIELLTETPVPVVTVIHGTAAGGGLGLGLCGAVILMASTAKLRFAYTSVGLSPDCGTSWLLMRRVGMARALDLALLDRLTTGAEALQWGLVTRVADPDSLTAEAEAIATELASGSRRALAETKRLMHHAATVPLGQQLEAEADTIATLISEPDGREGVDAFLGKRSPEFN